MVLSSTRWHVISPPYYQWERDALEYIRENLPDNESYRAWTNFEFISDDGSINEVDLLILTPCGFFLVEIKSRPGALSGDAMTWVWKTDGKVASFDNPLLLANRKAKRLASLLRRQKAVQKLRVPFLEAIVFCSAPRLQFHLSGHAANHVCLHEQSDHSAGRKILDALRNGKYPGGPPHVQAAIDRPMIRDLSKAIEQAGIRPSQRSRRVGDYLLGELLYESPTRTYQDWAATHASMESTRRRVRIYNIARNTSELDREFIRRAAQREFQLLEGIDHPGILKVLNFTDHELGPSLILQHDPDAERLDHYLAQHGEQLALDARLRLVREIAETLRHAHEKRLVHRALSPQSILVLEAASDKPRIRLFNWQTGFRLAGGTREAPRLGPTSHLDQLIEDASTVYLAPEAASDPEISGERLDIFSLGAIAYHIFSGAPPAANSATLNEKIRAGDGLRLSSVMNGVVTSLEELIQFSTNPDSGLRWTAAEFLAQLEKVEEELTEPAPDYIANPLDAKVNDRLEGRFTVRSRLGKGSSATAFVVEKDGREMVLKLANDPDHNDVLTAEAEVVKKLRHPTIIEFYEAVTIGGLAAYTMRKVTSDELDTVQTLREFLRIEKPLSTELLCLLGEDLLEAVRYLQQQGVAHRDIKPDNIVVGRINTSEPLGLALFDFSLSQTPVDKLRAGTAHYLDPFLETRKHWDSHAERFAAAVTLYEMATGEYPVWGDGESAPAMLDCEATIKDESFEPALRESLTTFFVRAFRRDAPRRFDNAEEMLRAWQNIFEKARTPEPVVSREADVDLDAALAHVTLQTEIFLLGLGHRAERALEKLGVVTVKDLLAFSLRRLNRTPNVGNKTQREIRRFVLALRARFPDEPVEPSTNGEARPKRSKSEDEPAVVSIDLIALQIARIGPEGKKGGERAILQAFLGLDAAGHTTAQSLAWPGQSEVARALKLTRARIGQVVAAARERWRRNASITELRRTIEQIVQARGGAVTLRELIEAVLDARGSVSLEPRRSEQAALVLRAALEAERGNDKPGFIERRLRGDLILITEQADLAAYVERLAREADAMAALDPLLQADRAIERLRAVQLPAGLASLPPLFPALFPALFNDARLLQLAVAASAQAALSAKQEVYPRNMPALRALQLSQGGLAGAHELPVEQLQRRVRGKYPQAEPLPDRPALDNLLDEAGIGLKWDDDANGGKGAYCWPRSAPPSNSTVPSLSVSHASSQLAGHPSERPAGFELPPELADARMLDDKLRRAAREGSFLALTVAPERMREAEAALLERFELQRRNLDELFLRVMREQAARLRVDWRVVLRADCAPRDGQDWRNLMLLVSRSAPLVEAELSQSEKTLLLVHPGLLARYQRLDLLEHLRERTATPGGGLHGVWVLVAGDHQSALPKLDGAPIPVLSNSQWARLTRSWIAESPRWQSGDG
ncbi:MAG: BREX system serine/threonine kinase PglW [Blastocatellia bacterium]